MYCTTKYSHKIYNKIAFGPGGNRMCVTVTPLMVPASSLDTWSSCQDVRTVYRVEWSVTTDRGRLCAGITA